MSDFAVNKKYVRKNKAVYRLSAYSFFVNISETGE